MRVEFVRGHIVELPNRSTLAYHPNRFYDVDDDLAAQLIQSGVVKDPNAPPPEPAKAAEASVQEAVPDKKEAEPEAQA